MNAVISVIGRDKVGIIARLSGICADASPLCANALCGDR